MGEQRPPGGDRLSRAAAHRLSLYLRCLTAWPEDGGKVSSGRIAEAVGVSDAQVRRDLAALGNLGQRGIGYDAKDLAAAIRSALGIDRTWRAVLVGVGNLARSPSFSTGSTVTPSTTCPTIRASLSNRPTISNPCARNPW